ncbi:Na+/H+ antiporter NhaA [Biformimicrobium ophioploci]|uniref:Na(+)/H(+) antiporter NhaA n=1 Tax=Biformimicrobium ophioploci TaxID=3036711 RepID=A0ABQ6LXP0_9GAMM|nr:Na+/H+ antiporter NhaA [Microbulbifer sp. NKW57]GMG86839.1 Na+/H+ antiporter NhaA [Microbulbifer sp. NKW57]
MAKINLDKFKIRKGEVYEAPLEQAFVRLISPFDEFIQRQSTSGLLLMICAVIALVIANSPLLDAYEHLLHIPVTLGVGDAKITLSLHHFINDGLMAIFFFLVGLELKREFRVGELSHFRQACLPVLSAIGGMLVPALIYYAINGSVEPASRGWGIPMATDIAFAVGCIALLGARVPHGAVTFLVALAIVDDLGAIMVIAIWYTESVNLVALAAAGIVFAMLFLLNFAGVHKPLGYIILGVLLWICFLKSGVHATLAGVVTAMAIPAKPKYDPVAFSSFVKEMMRGFDSSYRPGDEIIRNDAMRMRVTALADGADRAQAPLQRMEHRLHLPVAFLIIPIFALANAGIPFSHFQSAEAVANPVTIGVAMGLVFGKLIGIAGMAWLGVSLRIGELPTGVTFRHIIGIALLGGIGFTMSIFIAELGFYHHRDLLIQAKAGVLVGSLVAGIAGYLVLRSTPLPPAD